MPAAAPDPRARARRYLDTWLGRRCPPAAAARGATPRLCALLRELGRLPAGTPAPRRRAVAARLRGLLDLMAARVERHPEHMGALERGEMRLLRSHTTVEGFYMLAIVIGSVCLVFQIGKIVYAGNARAISLSFMILYMLSLMLRLPYFILFPSHVQLWYIATQAALVASLVGLTAWYHRHRDSGDRRDRRSEENGR